MVASEHKKYKDCVNDGSWFIYIQGYCLRLEKKIKNRFCWLIDQ